MRTQITPTDNLFKGNYIIYYALVAGQILIALVLSFLMIDSEIAFDWDMGNPFYLIAPTLMLGAISMSSFLFTKKMQEAKLIKRDLIYKLEHYRTAIILRSAMLEGANLICIVFYYLEQNYFFLFLFFIGLGAFLLVRPSEETVREKYKLTEEERVEFRKMTR